MGAAYMNTQLYQVIKTNNLEIWNIKMGCLVAYINPQPY